MNIQKLITNWKTTSSGLMLMIGSLTHLAFQFKAHAVDEGAITIFGVGFLGGIGLLLAADGKTPPTDPPPVPPVASGSSNASPPGTNIIGLFVIIGLLAGLAFMGCASGPQRIAYNTLYSVEKATTGAYDGFIDSVIANQTTTNSVPKVSRAYDHFQGSFLVALDTVQFNTNALAPASLVVESQDVINLILNLKGKK